MRATVLYCCVGYRTRIEVDVTPTNNKNTFVYCRYDFDRWYTSTLLSRVSIKNMGMPGDVDGGDTRSTYVYAIYRQFGTISNTTQQYTQTRGHDHRARSFFFTTLGGPAPLLVVLPAARESIKRNMVTKRKTRGQAA